MAAALYKYVGGIIFILGVLGNVLTIAVLTRWHMRNNNTSLYLTVLAVSDLTMLVVGQPLKNWTKGLTGIDLTAHSDWSCKLWYYAISVPAVYSNYVLAGVSLERCIAIVAPLRSRRFLTRTNAAIYLLVTLFALAAYLTYSLFLNHQKIYYDIEGNKMMYCTFDDNGLFVATVRPWSDLIIRTLVTGTVIVCSNVVIIHYLLLARHKRQKYLSEDRGDTSIEDNFSATAAMLVSISVAFVIIMTPVHVMYILNDVYPLSASTADHGAAVVRLMWAIVIALSYLNNAINFYLYVISGKYFRSELLSMARGVIRFMCRCEKNQTKTSENKPQSNLSATLRNTVETVADCTTNGQNNI